MAYISILYFSMLLGSIGAFALFLPKGMIEPGLLGVAMTYALIVDSFLRIVVFIPIELEVQMNSVEGIKYYGDKVPVEAPSDIPETVAAESWPSEGISIKKLIMGYVAVLMSSNISFGVTTSKSGYRWSHRLGKSSLLIALFRVVAAFRFHHYRWCDISTPGLRQLARLGIIPQDPVYSLDHSAITLIHSKTTLTIDSGRC